MNNLDIGNNVIICIHNEDISSIKKIRGFDFHIQYYLELAKEDNKIKRVLESFNIQELIEDPSKVHATVNTKLVKEGSLLILNLSPNVEYKTNMAFVCMNDPRRLTNYQKEMIQKITSDPKNSDIEIYSLGVFDEEENDFIDKLPNEEFNQPNIHVLEQLLTKTKHK